LPNVLNGIVKTQLIFSKESYEEKGIQLLLDSEQLTQGN